ncbi:MAG: hypothetical protein QM756_37275 [Polyangiaceae bacterium]
MPSVLHQALLALFQNRPELAAELLREALGIELPAYTGVRVEASSFSELEPAEYRADLVVALLSDDAPVFAIVVEVQLARDDRKGYTWPLYVVGLRARLRCDVALLVVTPDSGVAKWAAEPVYLGSQNYFTPLVLGPDGVPVVTDPLRAAADPELAVLSTMAHGHDDANLAVRIAMAATAGLGAVQDPDRIVLYSDLIEAALGEAARKAFQMIPPGYEIQSELIRGWVAKGEIKGRAEGEIKGRAEGEVKGRAEGEIKGRAEGEIKGRAEGEIKGRAEGLVESLFTVLEARGLAVSEQQRERVARTLDLAVLSRWLRGAVTATSVEQLLDV